MNNTTIQNNGNQHFEEYNFYNLGTDVNNTADCIDSVQKVGKLSSAVMATVIGVMADIVTIVAGLHELEIEGIWTMISNNKLCIYITIAGTILVIVIMLIRDIVLLCRNKSLSKFVLKENNIYEIIPKKCPICGTACNGKLKVKNLENGTFFVCHRDKTHMWKVEYNDVMNMI